MLNTDQLDKYMKAKKFKNFKFLGVFPSDVFPDKIPDKQNAGIIFNTDPHTKAGEHWVAVFIDNNPDKDHSYAVEFYDSMGDEPVKSIDKWIKRTFKGYKYKINRVQHQHILTKVRGKEEINEFCGAYAVLFLEKRAKGISFTDATHYKPSDKTAYDKFKMID